MINLYHRIRSSLPFMIAMAVLALLVYGAFQAVIYPYDGILNLQSNGLIYSIDARGPAIDKLFPGDVILMVEGKPVKDATPFYQGKRSGDLVNYVVDHGGVHVPVSIVLSDPSAKEVLNRLAPLFVALVFWVVGLGVQMFRLSFSAAGVSFLFFQTSALILTLGTLSSSIPSWPSGLLSVFLWIIGPLSVHFHLFFPQRTAFRRQGILLGFLYLTTFLGIAPYLLLDIEYFRSQTWYSQYISGAMLFMAFNLLLVVGLLVYSYRNTTVPGTRSKVRIVVLGGVLSAFPLVMLTLLPMALSLPPLLPYSIAFFMVGLLPLTYGYAIFRHHLIEIERHVNRGATFILVYSILGGIYLILYALMRRVSSPSTGGESIVNTLIVVILASIFAPLRRNVQRVVDIVFYGGWYDYRFAVKQITHGVEQITDLHELARIISDRLVRTLRLEDTIVFLRDLAGDFSVIEVAPLDELNKQGGLSFPVLPRSSLEFLLKMGESGGRSSMRDALSEVTLTAEEQQLLNSEQVHLWVPIIGRGQVQGYLALGPKYGGDIFSGEDMDILRFVAWQISPVMENIYLLTQLRQHAAELEERVSERTAELFDAKERVEAILSSVGDGVVVTNLQGNILLVNVAFEEQFGTLSEKLINRDYFALLSDHNEPYKLTEIRSTLYQKKIWSGELIHQGTDGKEHNFLLTIAPVYNQEGQLIGYVGSQRDITQQRELDRMKDRFVSDVSHELRTPVTNLGLYLELMEYANPQKRGEYLNVLKGQCSLLAHMVEEILDLSRLEMGKSKKIEFQDLDLNAITAQVVTAHRPLADASNLELRFEPDLSLSKVPGEPNQLARVITNLVSNSIRYTVHGEVVVRTLLQDGQVCLEVSDTGIGIDPEDQPHVFERFFRGRQVRQSKVHGTGLGLAICKEIVDLHGGRIEVYSTVGQGSTFRVWLPSHVEKPLLRLIETSSLGR